MESLDTARTGTDIHAQTFRLNLQSALLHCLRSRRQRKLRITVGTAHGVFVHLKLLRLEVDYFRRDTHLLPFGWHYFDGLHGAASVLQMCPKGGHTVTQSGNNPQTRYNNSFFHFKIIH